jgi:hypothetical protein
VLAGSSALERGFLIVDQCDHDVAGVGGFGLANERDVAVENAGLDHAVAAHFECEMFSGRQQVGRHVDDMAAGLDRLDRRAGGDAAHHRHRDRAGGVVIFLVLGGRAHAAEIALDHAGGKAARAAVAHPVRDGLGKLDDLDGARPVGEAPDEAALFQGGDQAVNAGFGPQVEGVLHFIEGGGDSGLGQALVDETQEL